MKRTILSVLAFCYLIPITQGQSISANGTTLANTTSAGAGTAWTTTFPASIVSFSSSATQTLEIGGFNFSALPAAATITGIELLINKSGTNFDNRVSLIKNNIIQPTNLASPVQWSFFGGTTTYGSSTQLWGTTWVPTDLQSPNFRVALRVTGAGFIFAIVNTVTVRVYYNLLAPITLSRFVVQKTSQNEVKVSWTTEMEDKVQMLYVERSTDGVHFSTLESVKPQGGRYSAKNYEVIDRNPVEGNNYYRLKELDTDGEYHYYMVKLIRFSSSKTKASAYYDGSNIVIDATGLKGDYTFVLSDQNGHVLQNRQVRINTQSQKIVLPAPARTGIYFLRMGNEMFNETSKMFIGR